MSPIVDALKSRGKEIIRRWTERVRVRLGETSPRPVLIDSLPEFVTCLGAALEARGGPDAAATAAAAAVAARHGAERSVLGVEVDQVVMEYRLLREVIVEVAREATEVTVDDVLALSDLLIDSAAAGLRAWSDERQALLRHAAELLELGDAFFELDRDWRYVRVNANQERLTGKPRSETLGRVFWDVWPDLGQPGNPYWDEYHRAMDDRVPREFDAYYAPLQLWTAVTAYPVEVGGIAVFFRDASARKRTEGELRRAREFEQQLIGIVSHDLRNPLSAILFGAGTLLSRDDLPDRHLRAVARMRSAAERATRLIHDLLDLTRTRLTGSLPVEPRTMDLGAVVEDAVNELRDASGDREIAVERHGSAKGIWDPDRLAQVASNLVANALKYGRPDRPVRVELDGRPSEVRLRVHNEGDPIPPELLDRLFQPWERAGQQGGAAQGVGLGLFIVERIVAAHGGCVSATSTADAGTTFVVRLPRAAGSELSPDAPSNPPGG